MQPHNGRPGHLHAWSLPYGTGTLLDHLVLHCGGFGCEQVFLVGSSASAELIAQGSREQIARVSGLSDAADQLEPSDTILLIDPRHWPGPHLSFQSILEESAAETGATHIMPVGVGRSRVVERLERDRHDRVCRIRRLYEPKTWLNEQSSAVAYSILPARLLHNLECASLRDLRLALVRRGVPTRDRTIAAPVIDLADAHSQLSMAETSVADTVEREILPEHYSRLSPGVLVGRGALVHGSTRIIGPVVIQPGSVIESEALIVGPTLIGENCVVRRGALVARSLILPEACVQQRSTVCDRVVSRSGISPALTRRVSTPAAASPALEEQDSSAIHDERIDHISDRSPSRPLYAFWKRASDFVLALAGLIVLSPLLILVAILVKLDSRGPVFFVHRRECRGGRDFPCLKFRSMHRDADLLQRRLYAENVVDGPQFKLQTDPRVTRLGRILRKANIDEMPQLFNVLVGHLSFVGPRPSPFRENQICVPWRQARLSVRPGITGLWQLCRSYNRAQGDFQEWIFYDLMYVRRMSAWLDFKILFATVLTLGGQFRVPLRWLLRENQPPYASAARRKRAGAWAFRRGQAPSPSGLPATADHVTSQCANPFTQTITAPPESEPERPVPARTAELNS